MVLSLFRSGFSRMQNLRPRWTLPKEAAPLPAANFVSTEKCLDDRGQRPLDSISGCMVLSEGRWVMRCAMHSPLW